MSGTLLVSTRKGLFTVARKAKQWEITAVEFLGDNVTLALSSRRPPLCGTRPRSFRRQASPLDRERVGGDRYADLSAQTGRLRGARHVGPAAQLEHGARLGARGRRRRRARRHLVRNAAGRALPL